MKRLIVFAIVVATLAMAGILYGNHVQTDRENTVTLEELYGAQFPAHMPDVILEPMAGFPVY